MAGAPETAPDVPEAVVGWRSWSIVTVDGRPRLVSPSRRTCWEPGEAVEASCPAGHAAPAEACGCGLYATRSPVAALRSVGGMVLGCASLWGDVVEGARGWRASRAYPRFLIVGPAVAPGVADSLARDYGVPVHRAPVPPDMLAALVLPGTALREPSVIWPEGALAELADDSRRLDVACEQMRTAGPGASAASFLATAGELVHHAARRSGWQGLREALVLLTCLCVAPGAWGAVLSLVNRVNEQHPSSWSGWLSLPVLAAGFCLLPVAGHSLNVACEMFAARAVSRLLRPPLIAALGLLTLVDACLVVTWVSDGVVRALWVWAILPTLSLLLPAAGWLRVWGRLVLPPVRKRTPLARAA